MLISLFSSFKHDTKTQAEEEEEEGAFRNKVMTSKSTDYKIYSRIIFINSYQ